MQKFINGKQAKEIDTESIQSYGIPSVVLMERAAESIARHMMKELKKETPVLAVCGTGNNGADAIAALRILFLEGYQNVEICYLGNEQKVSQEWKIQQNIVQKLGIPLKKYDSMQRMILSWRYSVCSANSVYSPVILDGVFGIGLSREVSGEYQKAIEEINQSQARVIAVDIPSGIDSSTGAVLGCAVRAQETITFGFVKTGCMFLPGAEYSGNISCYSIGFVTASLLQDRMIALEEKDIQEKLRKRLTWGHKGTFGKVLLIAGSKGMAGAAYLAALAAYRMGAGLVRIFTVEENRVILQTLIPEAIMTTYDENDISETQLEEILAWADGVVIGPGLGTQPYAHQLVKLVLKIIQSPFVLDADGLNILSQHRDWKLPENLAILTPHMGEMMRLCDVSMTELKKNPVFYGQGLARNLHAVVVLKDWRTLICDAGDLTYLNLTGTNGMGTGGSGDVLTGVLGALLAYHLSGQSLQEIAAIGVWIHGRAGELAAQKIGDRGMVASDIIDGIGKFDIDEGYVNMKCRTF
ncbi:MAG: NAD(P)H-hydrate dehydratase [Lachnospiraceae bacterium]